MTNPLRSKPVDMAYATLVTIGMAVPVLTLLWRLVLVVN